MYSECSEDFRQAVSSKIRSWKSRLSFSGTGTYIYGIDSIEMTNGSQSGEDITVGSVVAPTIKLTLTENPQALVERSFTWELGIFTGSDYSGILSNDSFEYIPMGQFVMKTVKRNGAKYECEANHKLSFADVTFASVLSFPTTAENLLQEACNSLGLTFKSTGLDPIIVDNLPEGTVRNVIGWCAGLYGMFATADRSDGIELRWYAPSNLTVPLYAQDEPVIHESDIQIGALKCIVRDDTVYTSGSGKTLVVNNPLVTPQVFDELTEKLIGFTYRPGTINMRLGNPLIDVWDVVNLSYENSAYSLPATEISHSFAGGLSTTIVAKGSTLPDTERVDTVSRIVNNIVKKAVSDSKSDIHRDIEQAVTDATEAIRGGADGFFYIVTEDGVNKETVWCDNIDPLKATYGIRINRAGIGFWSKELDPNANIFNGTYTNAWTIDGSLIADFIRVGTLKGIRIECDSGLIAGWSITAHSIVSPDNAVILESTYTEPLTTHNMLRQGVYKNSDLHKLTHQQIGFIKKRTMGNSQIVSKSGASQHIIKSAESRFYSSNILRSKTNISGQHFYDESGNYLGKVGYNRLSTDSQKKGLVFDGEAACSFLSWGIKEKSSSTTYLQKFAWYRDEGFRISDDIKFSSDVKFSGENFCIYGGNTADVYRSINMHGWDINNVDINVTSDARLKNNIKPSDVNALDMINKMEAVAFDWADGSGHEKLGYLSQQLASINADFVGTAQHNGSEIMTIRITELVPYLVKAVQELSAMVSAQQETIEQLCKTPSISKALPPSMRDPAKSKRQVNISDGKDYDQYKRFIKICRKGQECYGDSNNKLRYDFTQR